MPGVGDTYSYWLQEIPERTANPNRSTVRNMDAGEDRRIRLIVLSCTYVNGDYNGLTRLKQFFAEPSIQTRCYDFPDQWHRTVTKLAGYCALK